MRQNQKLKKVAVAVVGLLAIGVSSSFATLTDYSPSTSVGGTSVNATVVIFISGTTMSVTLTDLEANSSSVGNLLNSIQFNTPKTHPNFGCLEKRNAWRLRIGLSDQHLAG